MSGFLLGRDVPIFAVIERDNHINDERAQHGQQDSLSIDNEEGCNEDAGVKQQLGEPCPKSGTFLDVQRKNTDATQRGSMSENGK